MRIEEHPILDFSIPRREIEFFLNGRPCRAREGETLAAALWALGVRRFGLSRKKGEPRGPFCFIGRCHDCEVNVDGRPRVKACMTEVRPGMRVEIPGEEGDDDTLSP